MNKVILMGRLTRDPEIRYGGQDNQMAIARFSLAVDRRFKRAGDSANADFSNCTAFGKQAEFVERYLKQGTKILLSGRVQNDNYTIKKDRRYTVYRLLPRNWNSQRARTLLPTTRTWAADTLLRLVVRVPRLL